MDDADIVRIKRDFDAVCAKYRFADDAKAGEIADFLTQDASCMDTQAVAKRFGMTMRDANAFLMWIQIGTSFKASVIDKNAELLRSGQAL